MASTYGLAAQQVLQATVVLPTGEIVTANEAEHCDIFWAVRGGGAGQYGVVTEFVIKDFPAPLGVSSGTISIAPSTETGADASWDAATLVMQAPCLSRQAQQDRSSVPPLHHRPKVLWWCSLSGLSTRPRKSLTM